MWTIWSFFIFLHRFVFSANDVPSCKNGTVCSHGHLCIDNVCKECMKCELLFRKGSDCERDFNDCGPCLPGYTEISTTNFSNVVKPCRLKKLKSDICTKDEDCPVGNYCYEKSCAVCLDCTLLNKLPPSNGCAKDFNSCGFCMNGFYKLPVTTDSNLISCVRETQVEVKNFPKLILSFNNLLPFFIFLVLAAAVIKLMSRKNKARNDFTIENCEQTLIPSAPPLFVSDSSGSLLREEKNEKCSVITLANELKQQANTARVFKQPQAPYYFAEEGADDASDHSNDQVDDGPNAPQGSEAEGACSLSIFIHRYAEIREDNSPSQEINESTMEGREVNISVDNVDSETPAEETAKTSPQNEDSNSRKS